MERVKRIVFLTGTRADYGKMKSLFRAVEKEVTLESYIYITGMHLLEKFGSTYHEIVKDGFRNLHYADSQICGGLMSENLGREIIHFTSYIQQIQPDMIVVHGDRLEALAGATVGAFNNIRVSHIEGGEISGTIDESIRHAVSKLAHYHFVATDEAKRRLIQMGEVAESIYVIGSPDIDIMMSEALPSLEEAKTHYAIPFEEYSLVLFHPVTTEVDTIQAQAEQLARALVQSGQDYIVVYPNNDLGSEAILEVFTRYFQNQEHFKMFPSLRFEYFLTLLQHASSIIGNSSAGIREAGFYGVPCLDIGSRQFGRYTREDSPHVLHVVSNFEDIESGLAVLSTYACRKSQSWGGGNSDKAFINLITDSDFWKRGLQKRFVDIFD